MKYARRERERRFLLAAVPSEPHPRRVMIVDRYLTGTRLRLRLVTELGADELAADVTYKLTQKIPAPDGAPGLITTLYLTIAEYEALAGAPAKTLSKVRTSIPPFGVDEFQGPLAGLIMAEAEFDSDEESAAFRPPIEVVAEVTADPRFTGGRLVRRKADEIRALLAEYGLGRAPAGLKADQALEPPPTPGLLRRFRRRVPMLGVVTLNREADWAWIEAGPFTFRVNLPRETDFDDYQPGGASVNVRLGERELQVDVSLLGHFK